MTKLYSIGLDIGGTSSKYGIVNSEGKILEQGRLVTCETSDPIDFINRLTNVLLPIIEKFGGRENFSGLGIGAPNGNFYLGAVDRAPNLKWEGIVPLKKMFEESLGLPVVVTNDANAAAMGEMKYGNAQGLDDFLVVTLGTGLGSGFVVNGKVLYGTSGFAGELGHVTVEVNGRLCGCGRRGCLETYASATGIVRTIKSELESGKKSSLSLDGKDLTSAQITEAAMSGDKLSLEAFKYTGEILGMALANAVAITSPKKIFLFGGLAYSGEFLFGPTRESFAKYLHNIFRGTVEILPSGLPDADAAILGAAALLAE